MIKKIFFIFAMVLATASSMAIQLPEPMKPARLVNDFAGIFAPEQLNALEQKLTAFDRETSTQIAVVTVNDLDGTTASDYASQLFDKWGVGGGAKKDNGILILVKPKTADSNGEVFISTGYGIEGVVPDALAGRIVDFEMIPEFRNNNYFGGVDNAANTLMSLTRGEFTADQYVKNKSSRMPGFVPGLIIFIVIMILASFGGTKNSHTYTSGGDIAKGIIIGSLLSGAGRHSGGGFGGFSGGGGGFGGFGGGMSGGGGAGGSW